MSDSFELRKTVDDSTVDYYRRGIYRLTTIIPLVDKPERRTYELTQAELADFLEGYGDYAEFIVELRRHGEVAPAPDPASAKVTGPNITLKLFRARVADYHQLLEGGDTKKVTVNQLEDAAAEAMCHAIHLFDWLAKGGSPPDWTVR